MIKLKLAEMLEKRGMSAYALHIKSDKKLHQSVISKIKNNDSKALQLDTLDLICEILECSPCDLITRENGSATQSVNNTQSVNDTTQIVERATQNVKQSAPVASASGRWAELKAVKKESRIKEKDAKLLAETLAEENSGEGWKHSVLDIVQSSSDNELLSTVAVAARLNVSRKSVNDYIISGKLPAVKGKGNHNFIRESDLLAFMAKK